jgi:hypothetical protein
VQAVPAGTTLGDRQSRWVLLALQLPARPSNARVKLWRRLQQLGAVPVKHAVYVLPYSTQALEDFAWIRSEVETLGGQAAVFAASVIEAASDREIIEAFQRARSAEYDALNSDLELVWRRARKASLTTKETRVLRERFEGIRARDFFSAPGGTKVEARLTQLEALVKPSRPPLPAIAEVQRLRASDYVGRTWVTRPRPGVDRFASAWFIKRFIDPKARFRFDNDHPADPQVIAFDMYAGIGFTHEGDRCTFEVLQARFGIRDPLVNRIGELVHELDLKDDRYHAPHAAAIEMVIEGLRASIPDDTELLRHGCALFEALYAGLGGRGQPKRSRQVRTRQRRA